MRKIVSILLIIVFIMFLFMNNIVKAGVTDMGEITRITTTNYFTTVKIKILYKNEETGKFETFEKTSEEITGNIDNQDVLKEVKSLKEDYKNWATKNNKNYIDIENGSIDDYYYDVHDEITNDLDNNITINTVLNKHQTYLITNEIKYVHVDLQAPYIGKEVSIKNPEVPSDAILIGDADDILSFGYEQDNKPIVVTTEDNISIDDTAWVKGIYKEVGEGYDDYFFGTFEKDKFYYAMISISAKEGYYLANDLSIEINDEEEPAEVFAVFNNDNTHFIAKTKAKEEYKLGDVNQDGKVNSLDATLILKYVAKKKVLTDEQLALADVTKDGKVNSLDAVRILKFVAKKITEF